MCDYCHYESVNHEQKTAKNTANVENEEENEESSDGRSVDVKRKQIGKRINRKRQHEDAEWNDF